MEPFSNLQFSFPSHRKYHRTIVACSNCVTFRYRLPMDTARNHPLSNRPPRDPVPASSRVYRLEYNRDEFPRSLVPVGGRLVVISTLADSSSPGVRPMKCICIPSSIERLSQNLFVRCGYLCLVAFEPNSQLSSLDWKAFYLCASLQSICIPASVETIGQSCFALCSNLSNLAFERGSRLSHLGGWVFQSSFRLRTFCIPASLSDLRGSALVGGGLTSVTVDPGSRFFRVCGEFVVDISGVRLVRYFGNEREVAIWRDVEEVSMACFNGCESISSVIFEPGCKVRRFGVFAFAGCSSLHSICIPASVETIERECFSRCWKLSDVTFESGCRVSSFGDGAFLECAIGSIRIPASVETMFTSCFRKCECLSTIYLENGHKLSDRCVSSLRSIDQVCLKVGGR
jgi:hypothetical protein